MTPKKNPNRYRDYFKRSVAEKDVSDEPYELFVRASQPALFQSGLINGFKFKLIEGYCKFKIQYFTDIIQFY